MKLRMNFVLTMVLAVPLANCGGGKPASRSSGGNGANSGGGPSGQPFPTLAGPTMTKGALTLHGNEPFQPVSIDFSKAKAGQATCSATSEGDLFKESSRFILCTANAEQFSLPSYDAASKAQHFAIARVKGLLKPASEGPAPDVAYIKLEVQEQLTSINVLCSRDGFRSDFSGSHAIGYALDPTKKRLCKDIVRLTHAKPYAMEFKFSNNAATFSAPLSVLPQDDYGDLIPSRAAAPSNFNVVPLTATNAEAPATCISGTHALGALFKPPARLGDAAVCMKLGARPISVFGLGVRVAAGKAGAFQVDGSKGPFSVTIAAFVPTPTSANGGTNPTDISSGTYWLRAVVEEASNFSTGLVDTVGSLPASNAVYLSGITIRASGAFDKLNSVELEFENGEKKTVPLQNL